MLKKIFTLILAFACSMSMGVFASDLAETEAEQAVRLRKENVIFLQIDNYATVSNNRLTWIDLNNMSVQPYIKDGRTMVPARFIAEELGGSVGYDGETRTVTITLGDIVMGLTIDEKIYTLNGESFEMDCAAEIVEGRTFVPARFVSEALGRAVKWLGDERIVVITPADAVWVGDNNTVELTALAEVRLSLSPLGRNKVER